MGFEDWETDCLYKNVAGMMHMGEMKFKQRPREEQAEPDGEEGQSLERSNNAHRDAIWIKELKIVQKIRLIQTTLQCFILDAKRAGHCFGVDAEAFLKALTKPRVRVGTEWVNKGQNLEQVRNIFS